MGGPNTKRFRLPVNTGVRCDTFPEDVPLMDTNNFVLSPDGSELCPREGYEIRRNDSIGYNSGRKNIYFVSNPPDINYGDLIVVVNTKNNRRFNEVTEVVRTTQTASTIDPDGNLVEMPDNPSDYVLWRPIIAGIESIDDQNVSRRVIFMHRDTYATRTETLDWSNIHDMDCNLITTENLLVGGAMENFGGGDVGSGIGVFSLTDIAANPGATLHEPVNVWETDYANEFLVQFWVDRENNMVALYQRWSDDEWRIYSGPALDPKPGSYTVVNKAGFGANFSDAYSDGMNEYEDPPIIFGDGKLGLKIRYHDGSFTYRVGWIKTDGTCGVCAAAPAYADYWFNAICSPETSTDALVLTRMENGGDAVQVFTAADMDTSPTQATESGVTLVYDNFFRAVSNKAMTRLLGRGPDDGGILVNLSSGTLTSVATYPVDGGHVENETFGNDWIDDDRAILMEKNEATSEFEAIVLEGGDAGATLFSDTVGTFVDSFRYKQVMDCFAYRCINMNGVIDA